MNLIPLLPNLISLLLLFAPAMKVIPATALIMPTKLGTTHARIIWVDKNGVRGAENLTNAQYAAIVGTPAKPASFPGTAQEWIDCWERKPGAGAAVALGGRPDINTPSKEYELGTVEARSDGTFRIYLGDRDIDGFLRIQASDIAAGTMPNVILKPKCGLVTGSQGVISGTVDMLCFGVEK